MSSWTEQGERLALADQLTATLDTIHHLVDTTGQAYGGHRLADANLSALAITAQAITAIGLITATARRKRATSRRKP